MPKMEIIDKLQEVLIAMVVINYRYHYCYRKGRQLSPYNCVKLVSP